MSRLVINFFARQALLSLLAYALFMPTAVAQQSDSQQKDSSQKDWQALAANDVVLSAMRAELDRSKSQLKMEQVAAPYYIEYRVFDVDQYSAEASFGALRADVRSRMRFLRVVVRIGDYKQDSYFGQGQGTVGLGSGRESCFQDPGCALHLLRLTLQA